MANYIFPFHNVRDDQFLLLNNSVANNDEIIPLSVLNNIIFSNINANEDDHSAENDPDNYLINSLNYNNQSCEYFFPNDPDMTFPDYNNTFQSSVTMPIACLLILMILLIKLYCTFL